jgi:hypothetical protein
MLGGGVERAMSESVRFPSVCVIGTGPRGVAACRSLSQRGIPFDCFERLDSVAGSFVGSAGAASGVHRGESQDAANGPRVCAIADALESYVNRFGFRPRIAFDHAVEYVRRLRDGRWRVHFEQGPIKHYDAVFVATGRHHRPSPSTGADRLLPESLPFFDPEDREILLDDLPLWKHLIHPRYPSLFFLARLSTVRLTVTVAEEQSRFATGLIARDYPLPTRSQMDRERRIVRGSDHERGGDPSPCPSSVTDTRYLFHLRWERGRRTHLRDGTIGEARVKSGRHAVRSIPLKAQGATTN